MKQYKITPKPNSIQLTAFQFRKPRGSTKQEFEANGTHPNYPGVTYESGDYFIDRSWLGSHGSSHQLVKDKQWIVKYKDGYGAFTTATLKKFYDFDYDNKLLGINTGYSLVGNTNVTTGNK